MIFIIDIISSIPAGIYEMTLTFVSDLIHFIVPIFGKIISYLIMPICGRITIGISYLIMLIYKGIILILGCPVALGIYEKILTTMSQIIVPIYSNIISYLIMPIYKKITIVLGYFVAVGVYDLNLMANDDISLIGGPWIRSAKNIKYKDNFLCADLRVRHFTTNDYHNIYHKFYYKNSCIKVQNEFVNLTNNNGEFEIETENNNNIFSHELTFPRGSWAKTANWVTYFPNAICAHFLVDTRKSYLKFSGAWATTHEYNEDCIEYTNDAYLVEQSGKFIDVNGH